jgi:hypothetical protein
VNRLCLLIRALRVGQEPLAVALVGEDWILPEAMKGQMSEEEVRDTMPRAGLLAPLPRAMVGVDTAVGAGLEMAVVVAADITVVTAVLTIFQLFQSMAALVAALTTQAATRTTRLATMAAGR